MEKYKKYIRNVIPLIVMIICILGVLFASRNNPGLEFEYDQKYDGYIVSNAKGNISSYTIPKEYDDKKVIGIGVRAFFQHDSLEEVIFEAPENINIIDRLAFSECENLKTIDLRYVKEIGLNAFAYDKSLDNLVLNVKDVRASTFYKCENLKNIDILNVETIGSLSFSYTSFEEITLGKNIRRVYDDAFKYTDIKRINIPINFNSQYLNSQFGDKLVEYV